MTGKSKYAERMGAHLGQVVDAACPITRTGGTAAQMGGLLGAAIGSAVAGKNSDIPVGQFAWLGVAADSFAITGASAMGKPKGDPVRIAFRDVAGSVMSEGKLSIRVDMDLTDGRHLAFEAKRLGANKPNVEVLQLLQSRLGG